MPEQIAMESDPCQGGESDPCQGGEIGRHGQIGAGAGGGGYGGGLGSRGGGNTGGGGPAVHGSIDKEVIRRVVRANVNQIRQCYEATLLNNPGIGGTLKTKWTIRSDGSVGDVSASGIHADVEACVVTKIETWKFPAPAGGGSVVISYPFVLREAAP